MFLKSNRELYNCTDLTVVTALRIDAYELKGLLPLITKCINLERFELSKGGNYLEIPLGLLKMPKLKYLQFQQNYITVLQPSIIYAENLEVLDLTGNSIQEIPDHISGLKNLKELYLIKNPVKQIDEGILELKQLKTLHIGSGKFDKTPEVLTKLLPQLNEVWLDKKTEKEISKKHPEIHKEIPFCAFYAVKDLSLVRKLRNYFDEAKPGDRERACYLNLAMNNFEQAAAQADPKLIMNALNMKRFEVLRLCALDYIGAKFDDTNRDALKNAARLAVLGKLGINKNELRQKLKDHNISYTAKIDDKTTHVLVGQNPGEDVEIALNKGLYLLNEKNITDFWEAAEKPYILEMANESPEQIEAVSDMLLSGQEESINVAFSMFKQGGFPRSLITEVFIVYKTTSLSTQKEAERLIRQYGSAALIGKLKPYNFSFYHRQEESRTNRMIRELLKDCELDGIKLSRYLLKNFESGRSYLIKHLEEKAAIKFLKEMMDPDGDLDLADMDLQSLPPAFYALGDCLVSVSLKGNNLRSLSEDIIKMKTLKLINLRNNRQLQKKDALLQKLRESMPECIIAG
jgi:hypothetical protein